MADDDTTRAWEAKAQGMRARPLTKDEKAAIGEEILKGKIHAGVDARAKKRAIRRAMDSVRPGRTARA